MEINPLVLILTGGLVITSLFFISFAIVCIFYGKSEEKSFAKKFLVFFLSLIPVMVKLVIETWKMYT